MAYTISREACLTKKQFKIAWSMIIQPSEWSAWMPDVQMVLRENSEIVKEGEQIITYSAIRSKPTEQHWNVEFKDAKKQIIFHLTNELRMDKPGSRGIKNMRHIWIWNPKKDGGILNLTISWEFRSLLGKLFLSRYARSSFIGNAERILHHLVQAVSTTVLRPYQSLHEEE